MKEAREKALPAAQQKHLDQGKALHQAVPLLGCTTVSTGPGPSLFLTSSACRTATHLRKHFLRPVTPILSNKHTFRRIPDKSHCACEVLQPITIHNKPMVAPSKPP